MSETETTAPTHPNAADTPTNWSPADLIRDFLNPAYTLLDLCQIHRLTLPQLERALDHPWLAARLETHARLSTRRAQALKAAAQPQAIQALADATQRPDPPHAASPSLRLSVSAERRKAATKLLTPTPRRARRQGTNPKPAHPQTTGQPRVARSAPASIAPHTHRNHPGPGDRQSRAQRTSPLTPSAPGRNPARASMHPNPPVSSQAAQRGRPTAHPSHQPRAAGPPR